MTLNSDLQFIHKESGNSMTTAKWQSARLLPHWRQSTIIYNNHTITLRYRQANKQEKARQMKTIIFYNVH